MHTPWGGGQPIANTPFRRVIAVDATDNRMVVLAVDMPVGENVPPHAHAHEDQAIIVVSGTVGATLADEEFELTAGSVVFLPRGVPHGQWNKGDDIARVMGEVKEAYENALAAAGVVGVKVLVSLGHTISHVIRPDAAN